MNGPHHTNDDHPHPPDPTPHRDTPARPLPLVRSGPSHDAQDTIRRNDGTHAAPATHPGAANHPKHTRHPHTRHLVIGAATIALTAGAYLGSLTRADTAPTPPAPATASTTPRSTRVPDWDSGGPQTHPGIHPTPPRPAVVAQADTSAPACGIDTLSIVNTGTDGTMGHAATRLDATNVGTSPCTLHGWPDLRLEQGDPIALTLTHTTDDTDGRTRDPQLLLLDPGHTASTTLTWDTYGAAADSRTPKRLTMRLASAGERREVPLERPAPIDVVDGATVDLGPWRPAAPTS